MARSDEAEWWYNAVYDAVQQIPRGKVSSYGHIAWLLGQREMNQLSFTSSYLILLCRRWLHGRLNRSVSLWRTL